MANPVAVTTANVQTLFGILERGFPKGLRMETHLQPLIDSPDLLDRFIRWGNAGMPEVADPGLVYDAAAVGRLLGIHRCAAGCPTPAAVPGEMIVWYGGWSLKDLRDNPIVREKCMWLQDWYDQYGWSKEGIAPGYYRLRILIPNSNKKNFPNQTKLLLPGEEVLPVVIGATAWLVHYLETKQDLFRGQWTRCLEQGSGDDHVVLYVHDGRLNVGGSWDSSVNDGLWLSSARKLPELGTSNS